MSVVPADTGPEARRTPRWRKVVPVATQHLLLGFAALVMMAPFYWMLISSLKTNAEIFARPIDWWPSPARWGTYRDALNYPGFDFVRLFWNSIYYSGLTTIGTVASSALVGYGFARFNFPGKGLLFSITIATLIIPGV